MRLALFLLLSVGLNIGSTSSSHSRPESLQGAACSEVTLDVARIFHPPTAVEHTVKHLDPMAERLRFGFGVCCCLVSPSERI